MSTSRLDAVRKGTTSLGLLKREQLLQPGDRVGHCRVIEIIAAGGMANVYKVWHEQLEVIRAIKILKPGYNEESRGRLETEAKISANLRNSNIVEIYGMGYCKTVPYIEMEYIDGPSLKELLENNVRLSIPLSLSIAHYLCSALQFAYNQDMTLYGKVYDHLIHRDLKPANILLTSDGVVKLADFGIARPSEVSIHTVGSKIMGTFAYLSPEQLSGEKLDQRSDIYALGAVLYEMISGVKTFPQRLIGDLVQNKTKGYYTSLSSMGIPISKSVVNVIEKCLQLDKNKRFLDISDLDKALLLNLNRISNDPPEKIIKKELSESSEHVTLDKKFKRKHSILIIPLLIISIAAGLVILFNINERERIKSLSSEKHNQSDSTIILQQYDNAPVENITHQKQFSVTKKPKKDNLQDTFTIAMSAFSSGKYDEAITYLSNLSQNNSDFSSLIKIKLLLIESHIRLQQYELASAIIDQGSIETPSFYLLNGEIHYYKKQFDLAMNSFNKALSFKSIDSDVLFRIRLLRARASEEIYNLKPNTNNIKIANEYWSEFIECCCTESATSQICQDAKKKIQELTFR